MKREYDFYELARKHGFDVRQVEKVCRISDVLEGVSAIKFLRDHLSLYGGTALTFIYSKEILRLSIDLDLNYRHSDTKDWGEIRSEIDKKMKELLYRQKYRKSDIAINASYPLARITAKYTNTLESNDNFKIEIGYMRRIPILKKDTLKDFKHIGTQETFPIKSPMKEELFANKWCTLLYRGTPRDLFDVYQISQTKTDLEVFRKCSIVDSLMRGKPKLHEINVEKTIGAIHINSNLRNVLQTEQLSKLDFNEMKEQTAKFSKKVMKSLTQNEIKAIEKFFQLKKFDPDLIDEKMILHEKVQDHPAIQRALRTRNQ